MSKGRKRPVVIDFQKRERGLSSNVKNGGVGCSLDEKGSSGNEVEKGRSKALLKICQDGLIVFVKLKLGVKIVSNAFPPHGIHRGSGNHFLQEF